MIRKTTQEDYPLLLDIQKACISDLANTYSIPEIQAWTDYITEEGAGRYGQYENCIFEDESGYVAGFVSWSQDRDTNAGVECLYILPQFRNQNIGRLLLQEAEASLTPNTTIRIRSTLNAAPFYERQGYARTGNTVSRVGFRVVLLEKVHKFNYARI